ncbi:hypothetical protein ACEN2I_13955 [Flavobacterium sp. W22_SRS_FK3]|uniref:hypothetical protein n=1 Tax=Flavobacterium sp. W22_SRS_FK3 TaxID=3240275 RepID=UPI003F8DC351
MKKNIFIITSILILSCNHSAKKKAENEKTSKKVMRPFFDSDKIDYYHIDYTLNDYIAATDKTESEDQKEFSTIFMGYYPDSIPKDDFEKTLQKHKYKKEPLSIKQQKKVEDVFRQKDSLQMSAYACVAEYRDIFIFKKKEKTIGIAKICFKCGRFQIIGSKLDTEGFGLWTELDKLKRIVHKEEKLSSLEP